jgi:hypothetical protein
MKHPLLPLLLGACALLGSVASAQQDAVLDVVYLKDGKNEPGAVLDETLEGVSIKPQTGAKKVVPWQDVQMIEYGDAPEEFTSALAALGAENHELALEQLQGVLAAEDLREVIRQQALFHVAGLQRRLGMLDQARASYEQLLLDFPRGRFVRLAGENLVALQVQAGDAAGATSTLQNLAQNLEGMASKELVVGLLEAGLLLADGKVAEARARYDAVETAAGGNAEIAQEARLGKARTLVLEGKGSEAEPMLRALVVESKDPRVQSGAWNALGEMGAADGRARKDADKILDALYAYLRTVVQYKPLPGESTAEYERALAGAGTCFRYLSELEPNAEKKRLLRQRQTERLDQLEREFPSSPFLEKD